MSGARRAGLPASLESLALDLPAGDVEHVARALEAHTACPDAFGAARLRDLIPSPRFQRRVEDVVAAWKEHPATPGVALAVALRSAAAAHERHGNERLDVVWTGPATADVPFRRTDQVLLQLIRESEREVWLVSFAVHLVDDLIDAPRRARERGVAIKLVLESAEDSGGKLRYDSVGKLRAALPPPVSLLGWPLERREAGERGSTGALHAKIAVVDRSRLLVTSANLTEHALRLNMEMGLLARGATAAKVTEHLEGLVAAGVLAPY